MDISKFNFDFDTECNKQQHTYLNNIRLVYESIDSEDDDSFNKILIESIEQSKLFCINVLKEYHNQLTNFLSNQ